MNVVLQLMHRLFIAATILLSALFLASCSVSKNPLRKTIKLLQKGELKDDTSYVYSLPFEKGKKYRLVQGYFGPFSHKERAALDFAMKRGTKVCAARNGVVVRVKEDGDRGGMNRKYRPYGNNIVIEHADGTRAGYWHLQFNGALVNVGDTVQQGQVIGLSGKTGYAAMPHLHLLVWRYDNNRWEQIATRFRTQKGIVYLKGWKKYKRPDNE
ncbi:MAG TPA: M23 family metallopeptidase [Chitinophagaceae bacterium]|nr:M23 family metallopeptidase [Chitinophagaceae bacterium]MCB9055020.1 M23 family metallopeptidase [Chitinophagales bacterium]HRX92820.1 M23 family metallopeptidase [Chitinophagaceae bacterium]